LTAFLPSGGATIESYSTIITGLPYTLLQVRLEIAGRGVLPTSLPETFRHLGYRTRFFDGGFLSWQNVGDFSTSQGFDEVYGAKHAVPDAMANEWGVADQFLFDLVAKTVGDNRPSFNFIMTTSYHPPYNFDLKALGVELPTVPPELEEEFDCNRRQMLNILGHLRYADHAMGRFVDQTEAKLPKSLFVITGDHYSRRFINAEPTLFESSAVPLILYGKEVLRGVKLPERAAGSHIDVAATLIEAAAPRGFKYYAMGHNLLDPQSPAVGYNSERIISPDFVLDTGKKKELAPLPDRALPDDLPDLEALIHDVHTLQGIAWWRIRKGSELPAATVASRGGERQLLR
jgi:phosphoglycerol transferase MdoB-like AlkP superfamily enzyme